MWWHTLETKTAERSSGRTSSPLKTAQWNQDARSFAWRYAWCFHVDDVWNTVSVQVFRIPPNYMYCCIFTSLYILKSVHLVLFSRHPWKLRQMVFLHKIPTVNMFSWPSSCCSVERHSYQVPCASDILWADHYRPSHPGLHHLGLPGGRWGPQTEE